MNIFQKLSFQSNPTVVRKLNQIIQSWQLKVDRVEKLFKSKVLQWIQAQLHFLKPNNNDSTYRWRTARNFFRSFCQRNLSCLSEHTYSMYSRMGISAGCTSIKTNLNIYYICRVNLFFIWNFITYIRPKKNICLFKVTCFKKNRVGRSVFSFYFFILFYVTWFWVSGFVLSWYELIMCSFYP